MLFSDQRRWRIGGRPTEYIAISLQHSHDPFSQVHIIAPKSGAKNTMEREVRVLPSGSKRKMWRDVLVVNRDRVRVGVLTERVVSSPWWWEERRESKVARGTDEGFQYYANVREKTRGGREEGIRDVRQSPHSIFLNATCLKTSFALVISGTKHSFHWMVHRDHAGREETSSGKKSPFHKRGQYVDSSCHHSKPCSP